MDLALAVASLKRRLAWRMHWVVGTLLGGTELLTALALWSTVLAERGSIAGYDWDAMRTYYIIGFVTAGLAFGGTEMQAQRILDGMVSIDLLKPVDYQRARAAEFIGALAANLPTLVIGVAVATVLFDPLPPVSFTAGALALLSVVLMVPLVANVIYLSLMLCFWTRRYQGVVWARQTIIAFFSGMMVPLAFMPEPLQVIAWCLPFVHFTTTPTNIYLGRVGELGALGLIAVELAWVIALWYLGRYLWGKAVKIVTIHGG